MTRLTGRDAIEYAQKHGLTLSKYADPIEDGREDLTIDEAEDIIAEDPGLIYLDPPKPIIHEVRGQNFHGPYVIRLRGPAEGFELSEAQARKVRKALCGMPDCTCGGALRYGDGPEAGPCRIVRVFEEDWLKGIIEVLILAMTDNVDEREVIA